MLYLGLFFLWWAVGFWVVLLYRAYSKGMITLWDVIDSLKLGIFGLLVFIFVLLEGVYTIHIKITDYLQSKEDRVLWRSRKEKNKHILFGKDNE